MAGGCFWCLEAVFDDLKGVESVESGYSGGHVPNPTYKQVCSDTTGHAEVVRITFDPSVISYADLLRVFFAIHDPTTLNRQGNDVGTSYRSAIFYHDEEQKKTAEAIIKEITDARDLAESHRDRGDEVRCVLHGRGLPPGILCKKSLPGLLPGGRRSQGGEVQEAVRGAVEEIRYEFELDQLGPFTRNTTPLFHVRDIPVYGDAILAPMDGYSEWPYRSLCAELGSAMSYTEFVKAKNIIRAYEHMAPRLTYDEGERPVVFQLWSEEPDELVKAALMVQDKSPDIIDINMGCPAKTVAHIGAGVGLMRTPLKIARIFRKLSAALDVPVTGKIRLGWEELPQLQAGRPHPRGERRRADRRPRADEGAGLRR